MAMTNPTFLSFGPDAGEPGLASRLSRGAGCREEEVTIQSSVCRITWEEECSVARKTVGQRVVMETECADREVMDCKTVQMVYQEFPRSAICYQVLKIFKKIMLCIVSLGIAGGPGKAYEECGMVMRNLCEDVPNQKNVTAEVETCIQSPKEVRINPSLILIVTSIPFLKYRFEGVQSRGSKSLKIHL